jgi:hypothetical protein
MENLIKVLQQLGQDRVGAVYCENVILPKIENGEELREIDIKVLSSRFQNILKEYNRELVEEEIDAEYQLENEKACYGDMMQDVLQNR